MGINFPNSPTLGQKYPQPAVAGIPVYTWDGEKWTTVGGSIAAYAPPADAVPLMDATPGLVGTTTEYAREDHVHPTDTSRMPATAFEASMAYSGMQINGGMEVSQEFGSSPMTVSTAAGTSRYAVDGWKVQVGGDPLALNCWNAGPALSGFRAALQVTVATADAAAAANSHALIVHSIEGQRIFHLAWGTASAQPITISFWVQANRTGLYSGAISSGATPNRSYPFTFTINVSNTWEYKTITIPGETTSAASWPKDHLTGFYITIALMVGSTWQSAPGAWASGIYLGATGSINGVAATSDTMSITGVTVLPGTQAPTAAQSPNIMRPYDQELVTCQRYYRKIGGQAVGDVYFGGYGTSGGAVYGTLPISPLMRATPTIATFGTFASVNVGGTIIYPAMSSFTVKVANAAIGQVDYYGSVGGFSLDARL